MELDDPADGAEDPLGVGVRRLPVPDAPSELLARQPRPGADVDLAQIRIGRDRDAETRAGDLRGLVGAAKVARVDRLEALAGETHRQLARLGAAGVVERRVGVSLPATLAVPLGLAVA